MTMTMQQLNKITPHLITVTEHRGALPSFARLIAEGADLEPIQRVSLLDSLEVELRTLALGYEPTAHDGACHSQRVAAAKLAVAELDRIAPEITASMATVVIGGIELHAPADVVRLAGWVVYGSGATRDGSSDGIASRRLARALSERGAPLNVHDTLALFLRVIELGEIESAASRREAANERIAKLDVQAAEARARAAYLECRALGKED